MSAGLDTLLAGKRALVTGAAHGNGRAIALGLAAHGADVVATDLDLAGAERTAADVRASGRDAFAFRLDVTDAAGCRAIAQTIADQIGEIGILINNAGIIIREGLDSPRAAENWRRVLDGYEDSLELPAVHARQARSCTTSASFVYRYSGEFAAERTSGRYVCSLLSVR